MRCEDGTVARLAEGCGDVVVVSHKGGRCAA